MTSRRIYFCLLGAVFLLVAGLFAGTYEASQVLHAQSMKLYNARLQSQALQEEQQQLSKTKAAIAKYQSLGDLAKSIAPQDKDQAEAVRNIVQLASAQRIKLGNITFPSSTLGGVGGKAAVGKSSLSQLVPVEGVSGVYKLEIAVQSDGNAPISYGQMIAFLESLEQNRRTALVSDLALTPDQKNPGALSFSLTVDEYVKP